MLEQGLYVQLVAAGAVLAVVGVMFRRSRPVCLAAAMNKKLKGRPAVCVFLGSSMGRSPAYKEAANNLGEVLAKRGIALIYGGGNVGLMGVLATSCHQAGGTVVGVIPKALMTKELAGEDACIQPENSIIVGSMHQRKLVMAKLASAFIALPGGFGTLDESIEAITWTQIGVHCKPVGFLNVLGFWDPFINFFTHASQEGFIGPKALDIIISSTDADELVEKVLKHKPPIGYTDAWNDVKS